MQDVADFVERAKEAVKAPQSSFFTFRKQAKREEGYWKSGSTYLIIIREGFVIMHANDPEAENRDLRTPVPQVGTLLDALNKSSRMPQYIVYDDHEGVTGRYACAVAVDIPTLPDFLPSLLSLSEVFTTASCPKKALTLFSAAITPLKQRQVKWSMQKL